MSATITRGTCQTYCSLISLVSLEHFPLCYYKFLKIVTGFKPQIPKGQFGTSRRFSFNQPQSRRLSAWTYASHYQICTEIFRFFGTTKLQGRFIFWRLRVFRLLYNVTDYGGLLIMKANFDQMTREELRYYVLEHRDDSEAIRALFSRRSPDETATWYSTKEPREIAEILRRKINHELWR